MKMVKMVCRSAIITFVLLAIWIIASRYAANSFILPSVSEVAKAFQIHSSLIMKHASITARFMIYSVCMSIAIAIPIGILMHALPRVGTFMQAFFLVVKSLPSFALTPLILLWVGWGSYAVLVPASLMLLFPQVIAIYRGLNAAPKNILEQFKCWEASWFDTLRFVKIPYALPHFFSGLRVSLGLVATAVLAGEWVGSQEGIGVLLLQAKEGLDSSLSYAAILVLFGLALIFYLFGILLETHFMEKFRMIHVSRVSLVMLCMTLLQIHTGCSNQNSKNQIPQKTYIMLDWTPCPNHIPLVYGVKKGVFKRHGLDVELLNPGSNDPLHLVASGQIDGCISHLPRVLRAVDKGASLTVAAVIIDSTLNGIITTRSSLNGATVGIYGANGPSHMCKSIFDKASAQVNKWVYLRDDPVSCLATGQIDAIWGVYPNIEQVQLEYLGIPASFTSSSDFGFPKSFELVVILKGVNNKRAQALAQAVQESIILALDDPEEAYEVFFSVYEKNKSRILNWEKRSWQLTQEVLARKQEIPFEEYRTLGQWLFDNEIISKVPNYDVIAQPLRQDKRALEARILRSSDSSRRELVRNGIADL